MFGLFTLRNVPNIEQRDVLNLFDVEGEGGYRNKQYTFMDGATAYFNDGILADVQKQLKDDTKLKKIVIDGQNYNYLENVLRVVLGNENKCIMFRDGTVDISGKSYDYPYLKNNWNQVIDTFTPSIWGTEGEQLFLMRDGRVIIINTVTRVDGRLLFNEPAQYIMTKNQAHRCDCIIAMIDGSMRQAWIRSDSKDNDTNKTNTGSLLIPNIKHENVQFCAVGDNPATKVVCFKNDLKSIYQFKLNGIFKITGVGDKISGLTLTDPDEYYISGMSQEFNLVLLTNKRLIVGNCKETYEATKLSSITKHTLTGGDKIVTPTAYTNIIKMLDGTYYITPPDGDPTGTKNNDTSSCYSVDPPIPYTYFNKLKEYLTPLKKAR
jgi:hypothetical protein